MFLLFEYRVHVNEEFGTLRVHANALPVSERGKTPQGGEIAANSWTNQSNEKTKENKAIRNVIQKDGL